MRCHTCGLSSTHREQLRCILTAGREEPSSVGNLQLPTEITEVGKLLKRRSSKRKRADDDEFFPGSVRRAPSSAKRRYSGAVERPSKRQSLHSRQSSSRSTLMPWATLTVQ